MFRYATLVLGLTFVWASIAPAQPQCINRISLVPFRPGKAAAQARNFTRFRYSLSSTDVLLIRSYEDTETSIGPYDTGLGITRSGKLLQRFSLRDVPEIRREEPDYANSFSSLAVARACTATGPIFFVTMQYQGDMTSPALLFVLIPVGNEYRISTLPMISGGVFEISRANPLHLTTWDNLHEGDCEACSTAYEVADYEIRDAKPVLMRKYRTQHRYTSGQFDSRRRVKFTR